MTILSKTEFLDAWLDIHLYRRLKNYIQAFYAKVTRTILLEISAKNKPLNGSATLYVPGKDL